MKTVKIELPDEQAEALARAAAERGFSSSSELVLETIGVLISTPHVEYDPDALARDIARHKAAKRLGEAGLSPDEARAWLQNTRSA